jgi:uncharacterized protein
MLDDCMSGDRQFGVVCRMDHVPELEIPLGTVGCIAQIETAQHLPDGRSNILVSGLERFTLERFVADPAPYHVGEVATITDVAEPITLLDPLAHELRRIFDRVGRSARTIADDTSPLPELPDDPAQMSFAVSQFIDLELATKQRLLSSRSPSERLRQLAELLGSVVDNVEARAKVHLRALGNGHGQQAEAP